MVDIDEYLPAHPDASSISPETWRRFENATLAVVHRIQPTASSEYLRAAVIDYLQRLVRFHTGCQVTIHAPLFWCLTLLCASMT
jgi:alpha-D-ribose 1-methylphosphonate 5-triphosphate synthase subunit PhnH